MLLYYSSIVSANTIQVIESQVKLSVCGDSVIEGPEDCEGLDLGGATCESAGSFSGGELSCTVSCDFDTSLCIPLPSPSPTPTPTPAPSASSDSQNQGGSGSQDGSIDNNSDTSTATTTSTELVADILEVLSQLLPTIDSPETFEENRIPQKILLLLDGATVLNREQLLAVLERFAAYWRQSLTDPTVIADQSCDLNNDNVCDIIDLSVLLYYVEGA